MVVTGMAENQEVITRRHNAPVYGGDLRQWKCSATSVQEEDYRVAVVAVREWQKREPAPGRGPDGRFRQEAAGMGEDES
jgi:hypothetical protein